MSILLSYVDAFMIKFEYQVVVAANQELEVRIKNNGKQVWEENLLIHSQKFLVSILPSWKRSQFHKQEKYYKYSKFDHVKGCEYADGAHRFDHERCLITNVLYLCDDYFLEKLYFFIIVLINIVSCPLRIK